MCAHLLGYNKVRYVQTSRPDVIRTKLDLPKTVDQRLAKYALNFQFAQRFHLFLDVVVHV